MSLDLEVIACTHRFVSLRSKCYLQQEEILQLSGLCSIMQGWSVLSNAKQRNREIENELKKLGGDLKLVNRYKVMQFQQGPPDEYAQQALQSFA